MGLLDAFSSEAGEAAAGRAYKSQKSGIKKGLAKATDAIQQGTDTASGYYDQAAVPWQDLYKRSLAGYDAYSDASGVNGAEGYDRATDSFRTSPGYQFMLDQGLDAVNRTAASRGLLASGNNSMDLTKYASGLADQQWDDYVNRLSPYLNQADTAAGGQAGVLQNQASMYSNEGTQLGNLQYGANTALGQAGADFAGNQFGAKNAANSNIWGAIGAGLGAGTKLLGML